ncbi:MAG: methenyltetrahydromethanopterin cyclohydrolase [Planctomycetaceae bacterium]
MNEEAEPTLNELAWDLVQQALFAADELRITLVDEIDGATVLDFGVDAIGSLGAGLALAEICTAGLAEISVTPGEVTGIGWPHLLVTTDSPVDACLLSQYAGWQISVGEFFGMGSGPMRAAAGREELFEAFDYKEDATHVVGVLESGQLPTVAAVREIAEKCGVETKHLALLVAPTASIAGNAQVVARSVETALHKLYELDYDVTRIESAVGWAPLSPVAANDLAGIGRTNDAILYGGRVTLLVSGDDESIEAVGPQVPSSGSAAHGKPFLEIFEAAGRDFYKIDPHLFSPAQIVFQNLETGRVHHYGRIEPDVLKKSFGL